MDSSSSSSMNASDDDDRASNNVLCRPSPLRYKELRIYAANWETAIYQAWILQILLSEILDVPATIETGSPDGNLNFYDPRSAYRPAATIPFYDGFETAARVNDCRTVKQRQPSSSSDEPYVPCSHVYPELWYSDPTTEARIEQGVADGAVDLPTSSGATAYNAVFVTKFTVEEDPTLASYVGLMGERNRRKLADTFRRPTRWGDYCDEVSADGCAAPDAVATGGPPPSLEFRNRLFVEGRYAGHFRATAANNCTGLNNATTNCTGHIGDYPCGWNSYVVPQAHHLNIALASDGSGGDGGGGSGAYTYQELVDMYRAANATRSHLMMRWWSPDPLFERFLGTDAEMFKVTLPTPTQACLEHRVWADDRCRANATREERVGDARGVCDDQRQILRKLVSTAARDGGGGPRRRQQRPNIPEALASPGYQAVQLYSMSDLRLLDLISYSFEHGDNPREAVCQWVVDHLDDYMYQFVPPTYPRHLEIRHEYSTQVVAAIVVGAIAALSVLAASVVVFVLRDKPAIRLAQIEFLAMMLVGSLLLSVAAIVTADNHTSASCVAALWVVGVGNALIFVPLIFKVSAINRLMQASQRHQRLIIKKNSLMWGVLGVCVLLLLYLAVWTIVDPPVVTEHSAEYEPTGEVTRTGETVYIGENTCSTESDLWYFFNFGWQMLLLLWAAFLAVQSRHVAKRFNETIWLALLIYASFILMIGQFVVFMLRGGMRASSLNACESLLYSFQAIATIVVYFVPRIMQIEDDAGTQQENRQTSHRSSVVVSGLAAFSETTRTDSRRSNRVTESGFDPSDGSILHSPQSSSLAYYHSTMGSSRRRRITVALPGLAEADDSEPLSENSMAPETGRVRRRRTLPHVELSAEFDGEQTARELPKSNGTLSESSETTL